MRGGPANVRNGAIREDSYQSLIKCDSRQEAITVAEREIREQRALRRQPADLMKNPAFTPVAGEGIQYSGQRPPGALPYAESSAASCGPGIVTFGDVYPGYWSLSPEAIAQVPEYMRPAANRSGHRVYTMMTASVLIAAMPHLFTTLERQAAPPTYLPGVDAIRNGELADTPANAFMARYNLFDKPSKTIRPSADLLRAENYFYLARV